MIILIEFWKGRSMELKLLKISQSITQILSEHVCLSKDEKEIISYQLRIKISDMLMFLVLFCIALIFNKHIDFVISYLSMGLSRTHIGGLHRKTYLGCCIHTFIFFASAIIISEFLFELEATLFIALFCILDVRYAPCPSKERGEYGNKARVRMKIFAIIGLLICLILCVTLPQYKNIILVTLIMVHIEFIVRYTRERRQKCLDGCANIF